MAQPSEYVLNPEHPVVRANPTGKHAVGKARYAVGETIVGERFAALAEAGPGRTPLLLRKRTVTTDPTRPPTATPAQAEVLAADVSPRPPLKDWRDPDRKFQFEDDGFDAGRPVQAPAPPEIRARDAEVAQGLHSLGMDKPLVKKVMGAMDGVQIAMDAMRSAGMDEDAIRAALGKASRMLEPADRAPDSEPPPRRPSVPPPASPPAPGVSEAQPAGQFEPISPADAAAEAVEASAGTPIARAAGLDALVETLEGAPAEPAPAEPASAEPAAPVPAEEVPVAEVPRTDSKGARRDGKRR